MNQPWVYMLNFKTVFFFFSTLLFYIHQEALWFLFNSWHMGGVICISEVIDISPGSLDSSLCFIQPSILHEVLCSRLNEQGDYIQLWCTPFPVWNQSIVLCPVLTAASWPAYRFLRRKGSWYGIPMSLRIFQFVVILTVKCFSVVIKAVDVFLELLCFFYDPTNVGNLISDSSAFSKSNLSIWSFSVHVLLKLSLQNFQDYFASMWDESKCVALWTVLACFSLEFEWKRIFSCPVATAEFSKFAGMLSELLQHHVLGFVTIHLKLYHLHYHWS